MINQPVKGLFLTFEGIDGAGKTTHLDALEQHWLKSGRDVVRTREPGGTPLAESLRHLVLHQPMDSLTESLLVFAARRDHLQQVIEPALQRGAWVMCDRFTDATFAYQGGGKGFDTGILSMLEQWVQMGRQPDLTLIFDVDPQIASQRLKQARNPDRFEALGHDFFDRVRSAYLQRVEQAPRRYAVIDASVSPNEVAAQVFSVLQSKGMA